MKWWDRGTHKKNRLINDKFMMVLKSRNRMMLETVTHKHPTFLHSIPAMTTLTDYCICKCWMRMTSDTNWTNEKRFFFLFHSLMTELGFGIIRWIDISIRLANFWNCLPTSLFTFVEFYTLFNQANENFPSDGGWWLRVENWWDNNWPKTNEISKWNEINNWE